MMLPGTEGITEIEGIDSLLVRHDHVLVIRHPLRNPVMTADGLQPPDFIHILEPHRIHLVGSVLLQQASQPFHPFPGGMNIRQNQRRHVLFSEAVRHHRVRSLHHGIGCNRFRGRHGDIHFVDAALSPVSAHLLNRIRRFRVAHRLIRQVDLEIRENRMIVPRLIFRHDHFELLEVEIIGTGIVVPRHNGGSVVTCILTH